MRRIVSKPLWQARSSRTRSVPPGRRQGQREELRSSSCIAARATSTGSPPPRRPRPGRAASRALPLGASGVAWEGRHWYVIERAASPEPTTFLPTLEALSAWLDDTLAEHGIDPCRIVLGGFSQGAAMAYALGLAAGRPSPAGILAFSGYLARVEGFDLDLEGRARLPVSIAHGDLRPQRQRRLRARSPWATRDGGPGRPLPRGYGRAHDYTGRRRPGAARARRGARLTGRDVVIASAGSEEAPPPHAPKGYALACTYRQSLGHALTSGDTKLHVPREALAALDVMSSRGLRPSRVTGPTQIDWSL